MFLQHFDGAVGDEEQDQEALENGQSAWESKDYAVVSSHAGLREDHSQRITKYNSSHSAQADERAQHRPQGRGCDILYILRCDGCVETAAEAQHKPAYDNGLDGVDLDEGGCEQVEGGDSEVGVPA